MTTYGHVIFMALEELDDIVVSILLIRKLESKELHSQSKIPTPEKRGELKNKLFLFDSEVLSDGPACFSVVNQFHHRMNSSRDV